VTTEIASDTSAFIGKGGEITTPSILLLADAEHTATAASIGGGGALLARISSLDAVAKDTGSVNVRIGAAAGDGSQSVAKITTTAGGIDADASLVSNVSSTSKGTGFGLVAAGDVKSTALNTSQATGRIGGNVDIVSAGGFDMQAKLVGHAIGAATGTNVGGRCEQLPGRCRL
jgi:hypothetical protein